VLLKTEGLPRARTWLLASERATELLGHEAFQIDYDVNDEKLMFSRFSEVSCHGVNACCVEIKPRANNVELTAKRVGKLAE